MAAAPPRLSGHLARPFSASAAATIAGAGSTIASHGRLAGATCGRSPGKIEPNARSLRASRWLALFPPRTGGPTFQRRPASAVSGLRGLRAALPPRQLAPQECRAIHPSPKRRATAGLTECRILGLAPVDPGQWDFRTAPGRWEMEPCPKLQWQIRRARAYSETSYAQPYERSSALGFLPPAGLAPSTSAWEPDPDGGSGIEI